MYFMGVDVHLKSYTVAIINKDLGIVVLEDVVLSDFIKHITEFKPHMVAIDAPYGPNFGYMNDPNYRNSLNPKLKGHYNKKVGEYELSRRGFSLYNTPDSLDKIGGWKLWMKSGIKLYKTLEEQFEYHLLDDSFINDFAYGMLEVFPHACFSVLAGYIPPNKSTETGINERIKILEKQGFENLSYNIKGSKSKKSDFLDALAAAYTAFAANISQICFVGDKREGQIALPVVNLKDKYKKKVKNGNELFDNNVYQDIIIKEATPKDAHALIHYVNTISDESDFLTFGVGEFNISLKEEEKILEDYLARENAIYLIATHENKIVGSLNFSGGTRSRISHTGELGVSVLKEYWGNGIGTSLIKYLINWAEESGIIKKINLGVREDNAKAIGLYKKLGFREEGKITREFLIDKVYYSALVMGYEID